MESEIVWYICFSPIPCAARDIPIQKCGIPQKIRLQLQTGKVLHMGKKRSATRPL